MASCKNKLSLLFYFFPQVEESVQILLDETAEVVGKDRVLAAYDLWTLPIPLKDSSTTNNGPDFKKMKI